MTDSLSTVSPVSMLRQPGRTLRRNMKPYQQKPLEKKYTLTSEPHHSNHLEGTNTTSHSLTNTLNSPSPTSSKPKVKHFKLTRFSQPGLSLSMVQRSSIFTQTKVVSLWAMSSPSTLTSRVLNSVPPPTTPPSIMGWPNL